MLKDSTYKEKFVLLRNWLPNIVTVVKADLRKDHLQQDWMFVKKYFANKNIQKLSIQELAEGYIQAIEQEEKAEEIAEFICHRWLVKNTDLYNYFEEELNKISPEFTELKELSADVSHKLVEHSVKEFGAERTYLFAVMNSVVFPEAVYTQLRKRASEEQVQEEKRSKIVQEKQSVEVLQRSHEQELARVTDRYEKKLLGLQKKYIQDTEALKKQIAALQRKLND